MKTRVKSRMSFSMLLLALCIFGFADWSSAAPRQIQPGGDTAVADMYASSLPARWDWRDHGGVTPVRKSWEVLCKSSWAFATMATFESKLKIVDGLDTDLSEQYLLSCNMEGWGCDKGKEAHAYNIWKFPSNQTGAGAVLESEEPYAISDESACLENYNHPYRAEDWLYVGGVQNGIPSISELKKAIFYYGPVYSMVCEGNAYIAYRGGLFQTDEKNVCNGGVNHAVQIIGWDDTTVPKGSWIVKDANSTAWGENGFMRITWSTSNIGYRSSYLVYKPEAKATFQVDYPNIGDLLISIGVGYGPAHPCLLSVSSQAWPGTNSLSKTVDLAQCQGFLSPNSNRPWFLTVFSPRPGFTGQIRDFRITYKGQTFVAKNIPRPIYGGMATYVYINPVTASNDDFDHALNIPNMPFSYGEDTNNATAQYYDPVFTCGNQSQGTHSVWFQYTAPGQGRLHVDTVGSGYDTLLGVWRGTNLNQLAAVACDDNSGGNLTSSLDTVIPAGRSYIEVADSNPSEVDSSSSSAPTNGGALRLHASITPCYTLGRSVYPYHSGDVSVDPAPNCGTRYLAGTQVTLTAIPWDSYAFKNWLGAASGTANPVTITMDQDKTVTARFLPCYSLDWNANPPGTGFTYRTPGPNCGNKYVAGTSVLLSAQATGGYAFHHWSGALTGNANPATLLMTSDKQVTLNQKRCYPLTTDVDPAKAGMVATARKNCWNGYFEGTTLSLQAVPNSLYRFDYWSGDVIGARNPISVTMSTSRTVLAHFALLPVTVEESGPDIQYDGWRYGRDANAHGGAFRSSNVTGDVLRFGFSGEAVSWISRKGPEQGQARVTIDGVDQGVFDLYSATPQWQWSQTFEKLQSGNHMVEIKVLGTKSLGSIGTYVVVDAFSVAGVVTEENSRAIAYNTWYPRLNTAASGGTFRVNKTAGATVSFTFTGTEVSWIFARGPSYGRAAVYLDGVLQGIIDQYAPTTQWKMRQKYSKLEYGPHTILIKVLGTKNPYASTTTVNIDAFVYQP